jgi:hypothetical protein
MLILIYKASKGSESFPDNCPFVIRYMRIRWAYCNSRIVPVKENAIPADCEEKSLFELPEKQQVKFLFMVRNHDRDSFAFASVGGLIMILFMVMGEVLSKCLFCSVCVFSPYLLLLPAIFIIGSFLFILIVMDDIYIAPGLSRSITYEEIGQIKNMCPKAYLSFLKGFIIIVPKKMAEECVPKITSFLVDEGLVY